MISFGSEGVGEFVWICSDSFGFFRVLLGSFGFVRVRLGFFKLRLGQEYRVVSLISFGFVRVPSNSFVLVCVCSGRDSLDSFVSICVFLCSFVFVCFRFDMFGFGRERRSFGYVRIGVCSFGSI